MSLPRIGEPMSEEEVDDLLAATGHGVLSLAKGNRAYGLPISFAYDEGRDRLLVELVNVGESKKGPFAEASEEVTLTVHRYEDEDTWESVIVTGALASIDREEVTDRAAARFFAQADDAAGEMRWVDTPEIERTWYALEIAEMSGRHGGRMPHERERGLVRFSNYDRSY